MSKKSLQLQQLNSKMLEFSTLNPMGAPPNGWIKAIRTALGMTLQQLGNKLNITKQAVLDIENREKEGAITLKSLKEMAQKMDMQLIYGFVPNDGSLDALIEKRAKELATKIVMRTSYSMNLEDQGVKKERIEKAIQERTEELKREMPKVLWD